MDKNSNTAKAMFFNAVPIGQLPKQCCSNRPDYLGNPGSNKEIQPNFAHFASQ